MRKNLSFLRSPSDLGKCWGFEGGPAEGGSVSRGSCQLFVAVLLPTESVLCHVAQGLGVLPGGCVVWGWPGHPGILDVCSALHRKVLITGMMCNSACPQGRVMLHKNIFPLDLCLHAMQVPVSLRWVP